MENATWTADVPSLLRRWSRLNDLLPLLVRTHRQAEADLRQARLELTRLASEIAVELRLSAAPDACYLTCDGKLYRLVPGVDGPPGSNPVVRLDAIHPREVNGEEFALLRAASRAPGDGDEGPPPY